eukprot:PhM_4_TR9425/c0_g1_i1/m.5804
MYSLVLLLIYVSIFSYNIFLEIRLEREDLMRVWVKDPCLLIVAHTLLEEVGLSLQRDHLHEVERVRCVVHLFVSERDHEAVGDELNVLRHELAVHPDQSHRERVADKLLLDRHGLADDALHLFLRELVLEVGFVEHAAEVAVQTLVARDELVAERQAGHQPALLEPENGAERAGEEDAFDGREGDQSVGKRLRGLDPADRPLRLLHDARDRFDGVEERVLLLGVLDVRVDQHRVHFRVDVLDGDLESVEAARLGDLHVVHEARREVLENNAVARGEEGEDVLDEVPLVVVEFRLPLLHVLREVHLLDSPERGLRFFVLAPDVLVLNGEENVAVRVLAQQRLLGLVRELRGDLSALCVVGVGGLAQGLLKLRAGDLGRAGGDVVGVAHLFLFLFLF